MEGYSVKSSISEPSNPINSELYLRAAAKKSQPDDNQKQVEYFSEKAASKMNEMPVWLSQLKSSNAAKPNSPNTAPDLDLKLAVSRSNNLDQNKTSPSPLFVGPISVT